MEGGAIFYWACKPVAGEGLDSHIQQSSPLIACGHRDGARVGKRRKGYTGTFVCPGSPENSGCY